MNDFALHADFLYGGPDFHVRFPFVSEATYLYRYTIRPRVKSYGESSTATRSPGRMRIKFLRIFPENWASPLFLFSSSTRNIALGSGSTTVAITSMASSFPLPSFDFFFSGSGLLIMCSYFNPERVFISLTSTGRWLRAAALKSKVPWR